ncbi:hypothetical protein [Agrococcus sp. KRD186]|uniref:hypothetical protein n=1 Tax=Agrococcus sp. KRD186 TaxID=2729730 RepID=UPI0019D08E43|nr:hypothetical protein [Agrococcus sp. KRD186]
MQVERLESMPLLAWVAHVRPDRSIETYVGEWVEAKDNAVFEGAWNGALEDASFDASYSFMGSGIIEHEWGGLAVTPCHTTEILYSVTTPSHGTHVSNSIALLLKACGAELDINYLDYERDALSISHGLRTLAKSIPLADNRKLNLHAYCNVRIGYDGSISESPKPNPPVPTDFAEYKSFLLTEVGGILANAARVSRRASYSPIVFCSNGYDSTLCATIGRELGCEEAVAYESKRAGRSDSGSPVARALGYPVIYEKDELEYLDYPVAHLFTANGELGTSIFFASAQPLLKGKALLSGVHGDKMWDRHYVEQGGPIVRSFVPDMARTEFRLAAGYVNIPPAFLTATVQPAINALSNAPEMASWTLGNDYDRPLPRRIVEEAGVPRELFGLAKPGGAASSLRFGNKWRVKRVMPRGSWDRFERYLTTAKRTRRRTLQWHFRSAVYLAFLAATVSSQRVPFVRPILRPHRWPTKLTCSPFAPSFLFPWAISELQEHAYQDVPRTVSGANVAP